jgi:hypothetical protein
MLLSKVGSLVRQQWAGLIALFLVLTTGSAYALAGSNTVFTDDIVDENVNTADIRRGAVDTTRIGEGQVKASDIGDGEVKAADVLNESLLDADLGVGSVGSSELKNGGVTNDDVAPNSLGSGRILDSTLTGADVAANSLTGADINEGTLTVGDGARAFALVRPQSCGAPPGPCEAAESHGISSVIYRGGGEYCITAPGIDPDTTPAVVSVEWSATAGFKGQASALTYESFHSECSGFVVVTERQPLLLADQGGGTNNVEVSGKAQEAPDVAFTIVIP